MAAKKKAAESPPKPQFKPEEQLDDGDRAELARVRRVINADNSFRLDQDIHYLKDMRMHELHYYDPLQVTIINTFMFKDEDAAKIAVDFARKLNE